MNQKFTHQETKDYFSVIDNEEVKKLSAGKHVLFFIRQFACAYHVENKLPQALNEIILN
jgi:hypothetical protein